MNDKTALEGGPVCATTHPKRSQPSGTRHAAASRIVEALAGMEGLDPDDYRRLLRDRVQSEKRRRAGGPA
jgi:hypothetical protein